jgi:hypothetical protein
VQLTQQQATTAPGPGGLVERPAEFHLVSHLEFDSLRHGGGDSGPDRLNFSQFRRGELA